MACWLRHRQSPLVHSFNTSRLLFIMLPRFNHYFPLWALIITLWAFFSHDFFARGSFAIVPLLSLIMFFMGLTLRLTDYQRTFKNPKAVLVGVSLQFLLMPIVAVVLAKGLQLSTALTTGMVVVGCCAGGTASNVICYLAKGDVALSISMTLASTLVGVIATPFLISFYLAADVEVDVLAMLYSIAQMVLLPVLFGSLLAHYFSAAVENLEYVLPTLSILAILLIIGIIVGLNAGRLLDVGVITLIAVVLHNSFGIAGGFYLSRLLGLDVRQSQTVAIEVGMQNSGLGVALATQFFSATAALPGALFSVWHNISGAILAARWAKKRDSLEYALLESQLPTE